jgi:hypothetical protein
LVKEVKRKYYLNDRNREAEENIARLLAETNYTEMRYAFEEKYLGRTEATVSEQLENMWKLEKNRKKKILVGLTYKNQFFFLF